MPEIPPYPEVLPDDVDPPESVIIPDLWFDAEVLRTMLDPLTDRPRLELRALDYNDVVLSYTPQIRVRVTLEIIDTEGNPVVV